VHCQLVWSGERSSWTNWKINSRRTPLVMTGMLTVESEEDLQPMWSSMESRVKNRRSRTKEQLGGKTGRRNIKRTDEEMRLEAGFYDYPEEENPEKSEK
jgi:hypothetical protein